MNTKKLCCIATLCLSFLLTGIGLWMNQEAEVLAKAIRICLECIGIG